MATPRPIHPFPARMAPEIALERVMSLPKGSVVLDPMCGSGTVNRIASECGLLSIGLDLDPLARLISTVWTSKVDLQTVETAKEEVLQEAARNLDVRLEWIDECASTRKFVDFWFEPAQQAELRALASVLAEKQGPEFDLLRVALSRTIITKENGASIARDASHSRPHRWFTHNAFNVFAGFRRAVGDITKKLLPEKLSEPAQVQLGDARVLGMVDSESVDFIVTSPPYLNAIDYMRGHRLSLVWLGHTVPSLRGIGGSSVGSERKAAVHRRDDKVLDWMERCCSGSPKLLPRERRMLERYGIDLRAIVGQYRRVLKHDGGMTVVIADSRLRGGIIHNSKLFELAAAEAGFTLEMCSERQLPARSRYLPIGSSQPTPLEGRMRSEYVMMFR